MVHCWRAVKNSREWWLGYEAYKISIKNGRAHVAVDLDDEEEAPGKGSLPSWPRGHKATKTDLKRDASALALIETLKTMMVEKEEAILRREEKRRREKEAACATFIDLTKQALQVQKLSPKPSCLTMRPSCSRRRAESCLRT
jgi:hypothetical protein